MEVRQADTGARRRLLLALVIVGLLGAVLIHSMPGLRSALLGWINAADGDPLARAIGVLRTLGILLGLMLAAPGAYFWVIALRIDASGEFPPPDMKVIREVKVLRGDDARGRAWLLRGMAIIFVVLAIASSATIWALADNLLR